MCPALMPKVRAISAMLAAWKPRRAKHAPAASRICRRRISAGELSSQPTSLAGPVSGSEFIAVSPVVGRAGFQPCRDTGGAGLVHGTPAAAQRPVEGHEIGAARRAQLDQPLLRSIERSLRIEHRQVAVDALPEAQLGEAAGFGG